MPVTTQGRVLSQDSRPRSEAPMSEKRTATVPSSSPPPQLRPVLAFYIFLAANLLAAAYAPIQDCDEVFNYWEPTHYLNHGYGLQTWEYSPEYAIRSWTYSGIHAGIISIGRLFLRSKVAEFYFLRAVLALACAGCETRLYSKIAKTLNPRVALFFLMAMVFSPGMFHASVAYLPSSFAMYCTMLGLAAFMDWRGGLRTAQGIMWFGVGASLGWPFAGALVLPFIFEEVILALMTQELFAAGLRIVDGTVRSFIILAIQACIDTFFFRKIVCVPLNIVLYNVFGGAERGPNIYGTEPWHFYARNLVINFNAWFILALVAMPLLVLQHYLRNQNTTRQTVLRSLVFISPFYLWLSIFTVQPHKEERFMYPAYPALALNAAISLHILLSYFGSNNPKTLVSKIPGQIKFAIVSVCILMAIDVGLWRTLGIATAYSAPLKVYAPLQPANVARPGDNVCLGKEWYRFPSSYHLPQGVKAKFVKSEFRGLLPGEFSEANIGFGLFPGAWMTPSGMNDRNQEDPGKYTDIAHCTFMVDSHFHGTTPSSLEPAYALDEENWERLKCEPFLDASATGLLGRLFWFPQWEILPERLRRRWGQYCLLRRRSVRGEEV